MIEVDESIGCVLITVRVVPRSSRTEIVGEHDGALKIKLRSPPVDGAANEELIRFLSKLFAVPQSNVEIVFGHSSRSKRVRITGVERSQVTALLQAKI